MGRLQQCCRLLRSTGSGGRGRQAIVREPDQVRDGRDYKLQLQAFAALFRSCLLVDGRGGVARIVDGVLAESLPLSGVRRGWRGIPGRKHAPALPGRAWGISWTGVRRSTWATAFDHQQGLLSLGDDAGPGRQQLRRDEAGRELWSACGIGVAQPPRRAFTKRSPPATFSLMGRECLLGELLPRQLVLVRNGYGLIGAAALNPFFD